MTEVARRGSSGLSPLSPDLSPEVADWAAELRTLFIATGISINRLVGLYPQIDKGSVSRYLAGKRVPRERWFLDVLTSTMEEAGRPLTPAAREHLAELQLRALQVAHPHEYRVRLISDELAAAVTCQREAERYARDLEEQLTERIRQVNELTADQRRLRTAWSRDRARLHRQRHRLAREIAELHEELELVRRRGLEAEYRCLQLEALLEHLDLQAPARPDAADGEVTNDTTLRILALAQQTADHAIADARREADDTLARARREAAEVLGKARQQAQEVTAPGRSQVKELAGGNDLRRSLPWPLPVEPGYPTSPKNGTKTPPSGVRFALREP